MPIKGILLLLSAVALFSLMNAEAKAASAVHHPIEILFYRSVIPLSFMVLFMAARRRFDLVETPQPYMQAVRSLAGTLGMLFSFWAYALIPMAEATALFFTCPLMVAAAAPVFLKEKASPVRIVALVAGFAGVVFIMQPGGTEIPPAALFLALAAAAMMAVNDIVLRIVGRTDSAFTTSFWLLCASVVLTGVFMPWLGVAPDVETLPLLIACGVLGGAGQMLRVQAFRHAEASLLAPFSYSAIIWSALLGWVLWHEAPDAAAIVGAALIVAAGLFLVRSSSK